MDWNELEFLSRDEFEQMAPSILQLEITRLGKLIAAEIEDPDARNVLVKARFEIRSYVACMEKYGVAAAGRGCESHLNAAVLAISAEAAQAGVPKRKTLHYIADRLQAVLNRVRLLY